MASDGRFTHRTQIVIIKNYSYEIFHITTLLDLFNELFSK